MDTKNLQAHTLLIVDDDDAYRENLYKILDRYFARILEARDGIGAFSVYESERPDLIITDISMPSLDGISFIKKIRTNDLETKIIVTSGRTDQNYLLDAIPLHISRFIVKPFVFEELFETIIGCFDEKEEKAGEIVFKHRCGGEEEACLCSLNRQNHTISCGHQTHDLSTKEFLLLDALIKNGNRVLSYDTIEDLVWEGEYMSSNALRSLIKKLRQKTCRDFIKNVASFGYRVDILPAKS